MPFYLAWIYSNFSHWNFKFFSISDLCLSYGTNPDLMPFIQTQFFVARYPQKLDCDGCTHTIAKSFLFRRANKSELKRRPITSLIKELFMTLVQEQELLLIHKLYKFDYLDLSKEIYLYMQINYTFSYLNHHHAII